MPKADLAGSDTLTNIGNMLGIPRRTMTWHATQEWFPKPVGELAGTKLYNVSAVALSLGIPRPY